MDIGFPFRFDGTGRTATADEDRHIRDMIEQVLFTSPGERVNRPRFGCGLLQLLFAPNSPEIAAAVQQTVHGALQQWLGDRVVIESVSAVSEDSTLRITVQYLVRRTQQRQTAQFTQGVGAL